MKFLVEITRSWDIDHDQRIPCTPWVSAEIVEANNIEDVKVEGCPLNISRLVVTELTHQK